VGDGFQDQARAFARDLGKRLQNSDVFFMAGAISFNVLIAIVPLVLLLMGISGIAVRTLSEREGRPTEEFLGVLLGYLPAIGGDIELARTVAGVVEGIIEERTGFSLIGAIILAWIATRLVGTLRVVLRNIFQTPEERGIVDGKIFDLKVVAIGGVLILLNVLVTIFARTFQAFGTDTLGTDGAAPVFLRWALGPLLGFVSAWLLFLLLYRYVPARRLAWRTAIVGATFTAVLYELMKEGFAWYVTSVANFGNAYGSLAVAAVLFSGSITAPWCSSWGDWSPVRSNSGGNRG
jgi:membrane protein